MSHLGRRPGPFWASVVFSEAGPITPSPAKGGSEGQAPVGMALCGPGAGKGAGGAAGGEWRGWLGGEKEVS